MSALAASAALAPAAYALPEDFVLEDYYRGWRTDLRQSTGTIDPQTCQILTGSADPKLFGHGDAVMPTYEDGNPVFYGNGNIKSVFGQQALQWISICEYHDHLQHRIGIDFIYEYEDRIKHLYGGRHFKYENPIAVNASRLPLSITAESPGLFLHAAKLGSAPVLVSNGEGYRTLAEGAVALTRAPAEFREELFPLEDRLLVRLDKFEGRNGTLVVALPPWVAKEGKDYAAINGQKVGLAPPPEPLAGEGGLFSEPLFAGGDPLVFVVPYEVDLSGGASLANAVLEIEVFPSILDKHLYQVWDGSCYRYRYGDAPPDPSMTTIYKAATGMPACVSLETARALEGAGWGIARPEDGSPVHVLTTATGFNGAYMEPYVPEAPVITYPGPPVLLEWYEKYEHSDYGYEPGGSCYALDRCSVDPDTGECLTVSQLYLQPGLCPLVQACGTQDSPEWHGENDAEYRNYVRQECTAEKLAEFVGENCGISSKACQETGNLCYEKEEDCSIYKNNMFYYQENQHLLRPLLDPE